MVERPTRNLRTVVGASHRSIHRELRALQKAIRTVHGGLADRLDQILVAMEPPTFESIAQLEGIEDPRAWPTRDRVVWLAERLVVAAEISMSLSACLQELIEDAKITGSFQAIERAESLLDRARQWRESIGLLDS